MINVSDNDSVTCQAQLKLWWVQSRVAAPKEASGATKNLGKKIIITTKRAVPIYLILILRKFIKIVAIGVARWCRCTPKATQKNF